MSKVLTVCSALRCILDQAMRHRAPRLVGR
jgi:hypothetical protein